MGRGACSKRETDGEDERERDSDMESVSDRVRKRE